ncbi:MAG: response regulator [Bacteroidota bacterium]
MKKIEFSSIRTNLTFWFLLLALSPLIIGMIITYRVDLKNSEEKTLEKLTAIRDLKVGQVETWIAEREGDLNVIARTCDLMALKQVLNESGINGKANSDKKMIRDILASYQKSYLVYKEIFIVNAKTGIVEISTNAFLEGLNKSNDSYFEEPLKTNRLYIKDIYYSPTTNENTMAFSVPLHGSVQNNSEIIGVIVARVDLHNSLYQLLLNRTGLGKTGETLIVNKDMVALNELRWYQNAPLQLHLKTLPALYSSQGKTGIISHTDYRGVKVLAAYTYIPETGWGFVCKQDWAELGESTNSLSKVLIILLVISFILITAIVYFLSKSISAPIINLDTDAKKIAGGDYSIRNSVKSTNELGRLSESINIMVESIAFRDKIQKGVAVISEAIIGHSTRKQYSEAILKRLLIETGASVVVFYTLNESESEFEPFDSIGANKNLLQPFMAEKPEGELGNTLSQKSICIIQNLPDDTLFSYKTSIGEIVPKEIVTIPVIDNKSKVIALISLVNINRFTLEAIEILNASWNVINSSYCNLLASEQTAILADNLFHSNQKLEAQSEELQEQSEELQLQTNELQKGSHELQLQNQELEMQRKQVEEANRLKSEFLSNMSHELRTPLNSINALSRVLMMQAKDKLTVEENEYLEVVERNGKRLLSLINDILDLSKIEAGKVELQPKALSLPALLNQVTDNIHPLAKQKKIKLDFILPEEPLEIETDENRLHQVLTNVIGNAVKFTNKGGVEVSVYSDSKTAHIQVKDTGIGISESVLTHIFEEFRQADGSMSRSYEGTGLGLSIAKKLIQALHGNISVESELGKGSVFTVSLPVKWEGQVENADLSWIHLNATSANSKTILVVDDDPKIVQQISNALEEGGYHSIGTTSGKEALKLALKYKPYAITLDIIMPEIDGWEVLQRLKANPETSHIPVIIISISDDKQTSFALGAVGYVAKPVDRQILISEIRKLNPSPITIMVVDDNPIDRKQVHDILQQENLDDIQAESGMQCLEMLQYHEPDVLVLDLMMPEMDGFQVLEEIRKNPKTRDLPVIVVTAKDLTEQDKEQLSGKVAAVLTKSTISPINIYEEIKRILYQIGSKKNPLLKPERYNKSKRILIVEDNKASVVQVQKILEQEGIIVDVAADGKQALEYINHTIPDGIILDLMMPDIDGFAVLDKIRGTTETRKLPVLILTAKTLTKNDLSRLSANNIQQLIQKGDVNAQELLNKVKTMLGMGLQTLVIAEKSVVFKAQDFKQPEKVVKFDNLRLKILIIEDNRDNRLTAKAILGEKYYIIEAVNGEEGVQKTLSEMPDLILLDISLPGMNGFEVVKQIKENEKSKHIPVIALTAKAMKNDREEIMSAGCDEYIAKPVDHEELLSKIETLLRKLSSNTV